MAFDWKNLTGSSQQNSQAQHTVGSSRDERKKKKKQEKILEEQEYQQQYECGTYAGGPRITAFDKSHVPTFRGEYKAVKSPQRDDPKTKGIKEKVSAFQISLFAKEAAKNERDSYNRYRIILIKDQSDKVEDIMSKTTDELRAERLLEEKKELSKRKEIPSLALVSPANEIDGVPVPVDKYLQFIKTRALEEERNNREDKTPVFEATYNKNKNNLEYDSSYIDIEKEFEKTLEEQIREKYREAIKGKEIAGQFVRNEQEEMDLWGKLIKANEERIDKDMWLFAETGVNIDTTEIIDTNNIESQLRTKLSTAREEEIDRSDETPPSQDTPYSIQKESEIAVDRDRYEDPSDKFEDMTEVEETQIFKGKRLQDIDKDGIGDKYEVGQDENHDGVPDKYQKPNFKNMSAKEKLDFEAELDYKSLDFERELGTYGQ